MTRAIVLAAGMGSRLGSLTAALPKTLLPVDAPRTILDVIVGNLAGVGVDHLAIVAGFQQQRIEERVGSLEATHGLAIEMIANDRVDCNNCYSLWLAMPTVTEPTLVVNGDTLHPVSVERALLAAPAAPVRLALDTVKVLGDEEMKVVLDADGAAARIHKQVPPAQAAGEYIGVSLIDAGTAEELRDALEVTWRGDPGRYYEDGFQRFLDDGGEVAVTPIGEVDWVEVDDADDLERARSIAPTL